MADNTKKLHELSTDDLHKQLKDAQEELMKKYKQDQESDAA